MTATRTRGRRRGPGRPRSDASRSAILKAAYEILKEGGFAGFTVEGVAARAGAGTATISRWRHDSRPSLNRPVRWPTCARRFIAPPPSTAAAPASCCAS
jgi:hypothetical protein